MNPRSRTALALTLLSFTVLFQELALIRWLPEAVRVVAYFPNLILLSSFVGLGIGCLRAGKRNLLWVWPAAVGLLFAVASALSRVAFTQESTSEHLWLLYADLGEHAPVVGDIRPAILALFPLAAAAFVAPGQLVAEQLEEFRRGGRALSGYAWDLVGSLSGVVAFAAACALRTRPVTWMAIVFISALPWFVGRGWRLMAWIAASALTLTIVARGSSERIYSPYYALEARRVKPMMDGGGSGIGVLANGSLHQYALPIGNPNLHAPMLDRIRESYHLPYRHLRAPPRRVLVLGAGTGNDVAVALAEGASRIDVVEIDPEIRRLGNFHPDHPYSSPRVQLFVTDARSFLDAGRGDRYDLIVFGTLDSMTRLSALSSVRLDNFVYTVESLRAARARLAPGGVLAMYFMVGTSHVAERLALIAREAFGDPPTVYRGEFGGLFNTVILAGAGVSAGAADAAERSPTSDQAPFIEPATDDWPYLYLAARGVSGFYLSLMLLLFAVGCAGVFAASPELRLSLRGGADGPMFWMGFAFLLLETKSVTAMALVWGVTWLTSAVVFGAILLMALLGTLVRDRLQISDTTLALLVVASLLATWLVPPAALLAVALPVRLLTSVLFVGVPVFFAALLFASIYTSRASASVAYGWNLLGAAAGGLCEFLSMAVGIRALHLAAAAAYLLVLLLSRARSARPATARTEAA